MSNFEPQTEIVLCNHVPFDKSYENSVLFDTKEEQQAFFRNRQVLTIPKNTYQRMSASSFKVQAKVDELREQGVNYCYWCNKNYSDKYYYAFVTSIEYVNPNTAIVYYELDDIQTYMFDIKYNPSYFQRKHYDLGNRDSEGNLTSFTCPIDDEGLNYGNTYKVESRENLVQVPDVSFMIFTSTITQSGEQKYSQMPLVLSYYILPVYVGQYYYSSFQLNGDELTQVEYLLNAFRTNSSMVGTLVSVHIVPFLPVSDLSYEYIDEHTINIKSSNLSYSSVSSGAKYIVFMDNKFDYYKFIEAHNTLSIFPKFSEQKLYMNPYSFNLLSTDRGNDFIVKNEFLGDDKLSITLRGTLSSQNKQMFVVDNYNGSDSDNLMDNAIIDESNSSLPIVDDYTASYIQSNKNAIEVARSNALATMNASINSANNNYATSQAQINAQKLQAKNNQDTASLNNNAQLLSTELQSAIGLIAGVVSTNAGGNVAQSINQGLQGATDWYTSRNDINNTMANALISSWANNEQSLNTKASALFTANTDYQNTIATLNAKYEDAKAVSDTARSLGNDYVFNVANGHDGIYLYHKRIRDEWVIKLTNYFKMYGYLANEVGSIDEAINNRELYNYVKLIQCNITGDLPQDKIMSIKGIFMTGITFYHRLKQNSGQESDYSCAYTNIATTFNDCLYDSETNVPRKSTHNVTLTYLGNYDIKILSNDKTNPTSINNIANGDEINLVATPKTSGYKVKGWYGYRLGTLYEGTTLNVKIYHDEEFCVILEQDS